MARGSRIKGRLTVRQQFDKRFCQRIEQRKENNGKRDIKGDVKFGRHSRHVWLETLRNANDVLKEWQRNTDADQSVDQIS